MFNKKVFAGLCLTVILTVTSVVPALAYAQTSQPTANVKAALQLKLQATATKAGVDIAGLSTKDAMAKIKASNQAKMQLKLQATATKAGVDIAGLSTKDAMAKIKASNQAKIQQKIQATATKAGVDIAGLSSKDAMAKIKATIQARKSGVQAN